MSIEVKRKNRKMSVFQLALFLTLGFLATVNAYEIPEQIPNSYVSPWHSGHYTKRFAAPEGQDNLVRVRRSSDTADLMSATASACRAAATAAENYSENDDDDSIGCKGCSCYGHSCWGGHGKK